MTNRRQRALVVALLALYFAAAVHMAFALPAHATPNELLNFEYIQVMRQIRGLPNRGLVDSEVRYTEWHQPPVYFTFAALFGLAVPVPPSDVNPPPPIVVTANPHYLSTPRGNLNPVVHIDPTNTPLLYTSRVAAALMGALGVAALYSAGRRVFGAAAGLLMASILAFQPSYLHLSGSVNNDMPLAAMASVAMAWAVMMATRSESPRHEHQPANPLWRYFVLGLLSAAAILTKANGVFVLVFPAVVWLGLLLRRYWPRLRRHAPPVPQRDLGRWRGSPLLAAVAISAGLLPLWIAWLWLNTVRMRDTLGLSGSLPVGRVLSLSPLDFSHVAPFLPSVWRSYWLDWSAGDVGYGPDWLYVAWLAAAVFMLLGYLWPIRSGIDRAPSALPAIRRVSLATPMVLLAFLGISYLYFAVKALTVKEAGWMVPEARWWLPGLPMLAWLLTAGYARWWSPRRRDAACRLAAAVPPLVALALLAFHLPALYPTADRLATAPAAASPLVFGDALTLLDVSAGAAVAGQPVPIVLTWRANRDLAVDYTVSTQLLLPAGDGWRKVAEHNSFPGQGMNPTAGWGAGDMWRDRLTLLPEATLNGPVRALVQVRVAADGAEALSPARDGAAADPPLVAELIVRPATPLVPLVSGEDNGAQPLLAGAFRLAGSAVEMTAAGPTVTLWWQVVAAPAKDYTIFVHLTDAGGSALAQADGVPDNGLSPTGIWQPGDVVRDVHHFAPGTALPSGGVILVGAYDPVSGERAPATLNGVTLRDNAVPLPLE